MWKLGNMSKSLKEMSEFIHPMQDIYARQFAPFSCEQSKLIQSVNTWQWGKDARGNTFCLLLKAINPPANIWGLHCSCTCPRIIRAFASDECLHTNEDQHAKRLLPVDHRSLSVDIQSVTEEATWSNLSQRREATCAELFSSRWHSSSWSRTPADHGLVSPFPSCKSQRRPIRVRRLLRGETPHRPSNNPFSGRLSGMSRWYCYFKLLWFIGEFLSMTILM